MIRKTSKTNSTRPPLTFDPTIAAIRFGTGRHPRMPDPPEPAALLERLRGTDMMAQRFPIPTFSDLLPEDARLRELGKQRRSQKGDRDAIMGELKAIRAADRERHAAMLRANIARTLDTTDPFRERLTRFWADHFTVKGRGGISRNTVATYVEEAIRPHLTGCFADMLQAAVTHPLMLIFLDQSTSVGTNSRVARSNPKRGLNENLAREVLELHTLGVGGSYRQSDVRELAELLAGMLASPGVGLKFMPGRGEPGAEQVLGRSYGRGLPRLADIYAVLEDLSRHPDTARHIARKLAVHFVSDTPDQALVDDVARAFLRSDGDLMITYAALLEHPAAWAPPLTKAKRPYDFISSALRALGLPGRELMALTLRDTRHNLLWPMARMGQTWEKPVGPDGWPEDEAHWITPQGLAVRITWSMGLTRRLGDRLPDPRAFVRTALGKHASEALHFAAKAAETREDGVGIILASPDFQKR